MAATQSADGQAARAVEDVGAFMIDQRPNMLHIRRWVSECGVRLQHFVRIGSCERALADAYIAVSAPERASSSITAS